MKLHIERKFYKELEKERSLIDHLAIIASLVGPLTAIPQVISVWSGSTEGVSIHTWGGFMVTSAIMLIYGLLNRLKPIILASTLWVVAEALVILGVLIGK